MMSQRDARTAGDNESDLDQGRQQASPLAAHFKVADEQKDGTQMVSKRRHKAACANCPKCGSDDTRRMSQNGKLMPYGQCFACRNVWAFDKGPAFSGDTRPGYGWAR